MSANITTPERRFLDALDRIENMPDAFTALFVHMSKLRPYNRKQQHMMIFKRMFEGALSGTQIQLYVFSNEDFAILGPNLNVSAFMRIVERITNIVKDDPFFFDYDRTHFSSSYELKRYFQQVYSMVERQEKEALAAPPKRNTQNTTRAVEPEDLESVLANMKNVNMLEFVQRQSAVKINPDDKAHSGAVVFQEYFTSMAGFTKKLAPDIDLFAGKWLFQYLSETLDIRMLEAVANTPLFFRPPSLNLNLNISTVFSKEFGNFARKFLVSGQKITVEVQLMDVFQNVTKYHEAKELLHKGGHKILLDGLDPLVLRFLDISKLDPDYIKLIWSPTLIDERQEEKLSEIINSLGIEKFVLARCDTEHAIKWGVGTGIKTFQGHFIDAMAGAMAKTACKYGAGCSLGECINRRRVIAGGMRMDCPNPVQLDAMPDIKT